MHQRKEFMGVNSKSFWESIVRVFLSHKQEFINVTMQHNATP